MCRSIKTLREGIELAGPDEVEAAALQFVRKVSGFRAPAEHNRQAFERAVAEITASAQRLLDDLVIAGKPTRVRSQEVTAGRADLP
jgi:hypothetical protein